MDGGWAALMVVSMVGAKADVMVGDLAVATVFG
jgi:hypothetical protein